VFIWTHARRYARSIQICKTFPSRKEITSFTFLKGLRYPHWFHFSQISRVEVVKKHEATADDILGRARHDASDSCVKLRPLRNTEEARQTTTNCSFMWYCRTSSVNAKRGNRFLKRDRVRSSVTTSRWFPLSESARSDGFLGTVGCGLCVGRSGRCSNNLLLPATWRDMTFGKAVRSLDIASHVACHVPVRI